MAFIGKSQPEEAQNISSDLTANQTDADVSSGSVFNDITNIVASELAVTSNDLETAREAASLKNANFISNDALSQIALNFDVLRAPATQATGTVTFQAKNLPVSAVTIPAGTIVQTQVKPNGAFVNYTTDSNGTLTTTAVFNSLTGYYEVNVNVTSVNFGTGNNLGVNSLTVLPNRITGINAVTNKQSISNATDEDSNETLVSNIRTRTLGSQLGTVTGYIALISEQFVDEISGVAVVGPFDSDNLRTQFGNEVDIPVISTDASSFTEILFHPGGDTTLFDSGRPVKTVATVVGTTNGTFYAQGVDWGFNQDTGVVFGYSATSFDALTWFPGHNPPPGLRLTVQGTNNAVVREIQAFLDNPTKRYITGDLLVKEAQEISIDITLSVSASSGVDRMQLATDIQTALTNALAEYTLGQDVQSDDIINIVENVIGVDTVDVPLTVLKKSTDIANSDPIDIRQQEHVKAGTLTINVS